MKTKTNIKSSKTTEILNSIKELKDQQVKLEIVVSEMHRLRKKTGLVDKQEKLKQIRERIVALEKGLTIAQSKRVGGNE